MSRHDAYVSAPEYRIYDADKEDSGDDLAIERDLKGVSGLVSKAVGQWFSKDDEAVAQIYRAKYSDVLHLDYEGGCPGIASLEDLEIKVDTDGDGSFADETALSASDFDLEPLQAALNLRPWDRLCIRRASSRRFIPGKLVQVTAIYGWPEVPELIQMLTAKWTKVWRIEGPEGTGQINEMGIVVSMSLDVKRLVDRAVSAYGSKVTF